jgi:hypothetical protein
MQMLLLMNEKKLRISSGASTRLRISGIFKLFGRAHFSSAT